MPELPLLMHSATLPYAHKELTVDDVEGGRKLIYQLEIGTWLLGSFS